MRADRLDVFGRPLLRTEAAQFQQEWWERLVHRGRGRLAQAEAEEPLLAEAEEPPLAEAEDAPLDEAEGPDGPPLAEAMLFQQEWWEEPTFEEQPPPEAPEEAPPAEQPPPAAAEVPRLTRWAVRDVVEVAVDADERLPMMVPKPRAPPSQFVPMPSFVPNDAAVRAAHYLYQ